MKVRLVFILFILTLINNSCTKLKETVGGNLTTGQISNNTVSELLSGVYGSLEWTFTSYLEIFALADITTDEAIVPTRGSDWDDNGTWRMLHTHRWDANNMQVHDCFKSLSGVVFAATDLLQYNPSVQEKAEARFLRAFAMYWLLDLYDQVPYRDPGENIVNPARIRKGIEALNYIIAEINAVQADLPNGPANRANKYAARTLLMKCYLNKAVYANRAEPSFDPADMNKVISLADEIIINGGFSFSTNYFDNFSPINSSKSKENIFTLASNSDGSYQIAFAWQSTLQYAQNGFNGFTTLSDFYNRFQSADKRKEAVFSYPGSPPNPGNRVNVGFLIGQQYDLFTDAPLSWSGLPVVLTPEVKIIETGTNLDMTGVRGIKYAPDYFNFGVFGSTPTNEFVFFRFTDVLLMKAEAILRNGTPTNAGAYGNTAVSIVNAVRTDASRGASALPSVSLNDVYDERGREFWWENWRRQDMIRFKKFLLPFQEKNYQSDPKYLVFPIPAEQLAVNPNLQQNPGY